MSNAPNFPPSLPINRPNQVQKDFFPFAAFRSDDPNNTAIPILELIAPWALSASNPFAKTAALLASSNPVLPNGQIGYETDTKFFKIGDGTTAYASLTYQWKQPYVDPATKAPLPQTAAGPGQWKVIVSADGGALSLPAGGTWAWIGWQYNSGNGAMVAQANAADVEAGGTQICDGASGGFTKQAQCYEILDAKGFDDSQPIYAREDGSFVITAETGHPYHVLTHEQAGAQGTKHDALYDRVAAHVAGHPECLQPEPVPEAVKSNPEAQLAQEIMADYIETQKQTKKWQDRKVQIIKENP
jgi:hypothetical protein